MVGRRTDYNQQIADRICELIADGKSVRQICMLYKDDETFPSRATILRWLNLYPDFEAKCERARVLQGDENFDRVGETIDKVERGEISPEMGRVILSGLQWRAAKLNSKKYGDKQQVDHNHTITLAQMIDNSYELEKQAKTIEGEKIQLDKAD